MSVATETREQVAGLQRQGVPKREIATRLVVSVMTVSALARSTPSFLERSCALCGARFVPTNGRQRYCRPEHRALHRLAMTLGLECPHCGVAFLLQDATEPGRPCEHPQGPAPSAPSRPRRRRPERSTVAAWTEYLQLLEGDVAQLRAEVEARA